MSIAAAFGTTDVAKSNIFACVSQDEIGAALAMVVVVRKREHFWARTVGQVFISIVSNHESRVFGSWFASLGHGY